MKVGTDAVLLGTWADIDTTCRHILDIGTGSGVLALLAAARNNNAVITGIECDAASYGDAVRNFARSPFASRCMAVHADITEYRPDTRPCLILCNPPFFSERVLSPNTRRATARSTGALCPEFAVTYAARYLSDTGTLAMISPGDSENAVRTEVAVAGLHVQRTTLVTLRVGGSKKRMLWQIGRTPATEIRTGFCIRNADNTYTAEYTRLVSPFFLRMPPA